MGSTLLNSKFKRSIQTVCKGPQIHKTIMTRINIRDYLHLEEDDCNYEKKLTQDEKDEMLEAFMLYDTDRDGLISTKELGKVIRALGQILRVCEEMDIIAEFAHEKCYAIDFIMFYRLMLARKKIFDEEDELRESFRKFDKEENGFVDKNNLKLMLMTIGEPLTEEEVDEWLQSGKEFIRGSKLYYEEFATYMLSK